jgi:hypothetical protein
MHVFFCKAYTKKREVPQSMLVSQFSVTVTNTCANHLAKRRGLFWFMVFEVSSHIAFPVAFWLYITVGA